MSECGLVHMEANRQHQISHRGVTGRCEPPEMSAGNQTPGLNTLNH